MMEYNYNKIQDFLNNDSFVQWVVYGKNNLFWEQFLRDNPAKINLVEEAQELILEINKIERNQVTELNQNAIWEKIQKELHLEEKEIHLVKPRKRRIWKVAACMLILLISGTLFWKNQSQGEIAYGDLVAIIKEGNPIIERVNENSEPMNVELEDGSVVTLEKNSKLSYPVHFDKYKRTVVLSGEAFFKIAKNPNKPFYVYANEIVTKVLGTSFRIQAFDKGEHVTVKVKTGRVSVYNQRSINLADPETNGLLLVPNQQAVYSRTNDDLTKSIVDLPMPIQGESTVPVSNYFDEAPVNKILEAIEKSYGIKIIFNEETLSNCYITTKLKDESLYDQLDLICEIIGATYKEVDAQIVLDSKGCK
jgi:transmembrane sensor